MRRFAGIDDLKNALGKVLGESEWLVVTQEMIDRFAEATGDFAWIHVDRERAKNSRFGQTIAHGYLTLSLLTELGRQVYQVDNLAMRLNYGCNKVRFPTPVPSGSRVRARYKLLAVTAEAKGYTLTTEATVELEGASRPACVAEIMGFLIPA